MDSAIPFALVLVACGGTIDVLDDAAADARHTAPADAGSFTDASMSIDVNAGCSRATVSIGMSGDGCKENATWTCNGNVYAAGGACNTQTHPEPRTPGLTGSCMTNNVPTKVIVDSKCQCVDPTAVAMQFAKLCNFPPPVP